MELTINGRDVEFVKGNGFYAARCPFHGGTAHTLLYQDGAYECIVCGASGRTEDIQIQEEEDDWVQEGSQAIHESLAKLTESIQKERLYALNEEACRAFEHNLHGKFGAEGMKYLKERKLTDETIQSFRLGFASQGIPLENLLAKKGFTRKEMALSGLFNENDDGTLWFAFQNRVMYPIMDEKSRIIGFGGRITYDGEPKYKNSPETPVFSKRENLFAYDRALKSGRNFLILCEGYMDVISMHQAGFTNAVASLGTAFTEEQSRLIRDTFDTVVLLYDTDIPGRKATDRAIAITRKAGIQTFVSDSLPAKDPDEFLKRFGKEAFQEKIRTAETAEEYAVRTALDNERVGELADMLYMKTTKRARILLDRAQKK